ncbi:MAG: DUF4056 domain-containing protein [Sedimentisphaerales bacterium]|nr:DUF4056 domain-containing protein [Sedimentisphaerales bacterium]
MKDTYQVNVEKAVTIVSCLFLLFHAGCDGGGFEGGSVMAPPRGRVGRYASTSLGTMFLDAESIGRHGYYNGWTEKNGIVYTCKAGHIDIAHVRKAADWTAYTTANILNQLNKDKTEFSFRLKEASRHYVKLTYPDWWKDLPADEKNRIRKDIAVSLGQYFAYIGGAWHEIITWFGYRSTGIYPEFPSAFAWEDSFSDLFGTYVAAKALRDTEHEFDEAFTIALNQELKPLVPQSGRTARKASNSVRGLWFSGDFLFLMDMKARNFDIGMDDGVITPWLVPALSECAGAEAVSYPAPNFDLIKEYGFEIEYEFEPREPQRKKILQIVFGDKPNKRLIPAKHFLKITDYIREDAVVNHGCYVDGGHKTSGEDAEGEDAEGAEGDSSSGDTGSASVESKSVEQDGNKGSADSKGKSAETPAEATSGTTHAE